jgi:glycosyltransferase involved in cell wall biosynthesis
MPASARQDIDISVVICTRNRAGPLGVLLESMTRLDIPAGLRWELLIVDNGSTDGTAAVVESFAARLPVRCVREDKAGLSNARNRGVAEALGRYICWTDDDVAIDGGWLAAYAAAFAMHPEAAVFGGRIYPKLDAPTPRWFARLLDRWPLNGIVAARDFGDEPVQLDFSCDLVPWGANFAVQTAEQRQHPFDPQLGVSPNQRRSGEETQSMFEILSSGAVGWWVPDSKVFHLYPTRRQTRTYFYEHFVSIGEAQAYLDRNYPVHYMNRDGKSRRLVDANPVYLDLLIALHAGLFAGFHTVGMTLRSLYHLRKLGMYRGVAAYRKSAA